MAHKHAMRNAFIGTVLALGAATAANDVSAQAFQAGQCNIPMARFNEVLLDEGHRTLVVGERISVERDPSSPTGVRTARLANGITGDPAGTIGYRYEGNRPLGQISDTVCIRAVLTNVGLFDARQPQIARRAYLGGNFDLAVDASARENERPMIVADTVFGEGPSRRFGSPIVVFGDVVEKVGDITTPLPDGSAASITSLENVAYTQTALDRLNSRQVASLEANKPN